MVDLVIVYCLFAEKIIIKPIKQYTVMIKTLKERDNSDLLELVCQLNCRCLLNTSVSKEVNDAYVEARNEMERRLTPDTAEVPDDFLDYAKDARLQFCKSIIGQEWNTELRTAAESFVIAYNQMLDRLQPSTGYSQQDIIQALMKWGYSVNDREEILLALQNK